MVTAAITQLRTTAGRRPIASEIHEQNSRPKIETTPTQITRNEASVGLIFRTSTNKVVIHKLNPTVPVWLMPVRQATTMLRGYLNSSHQVAFSTRVTVVG